jgi:hypothetical protein
MSYIPKDARWYIAEVILEFVIERDSRNVVHTTTHLIEADSPALAYRKAVALGKQARLRYVNTDGKRVHIRYRGLRELNVIHENLEDGAELCFEEMVGLAESKLRRWITPKRALGVFAPMQPQPDRPNYLPRSVMRMLEKR